MIAKESEQSEIILKGVAASPGIAIGQAYLYTKQAPVVPERTLDDAEVDHEVERLQRAIARAEKELNKILSFAQQKLGDAKAKIFEAEVMILGDPYLNEAFMNRIRMERKNAEYVVSTELEKYEKLMLAAHDEYMHERAHDVDDLKNRIIRNLQEEKLISRLEGTPIIVSHALTPADTMILSRNDILAYATDLGGVTSHAALLSRSLKIPAVVGLGDITRQLVTGSTIILDGYSGVVVINPTDKHIEEYKEKEKRFLQFEAHLAGLKDLPAVTCDGHEVELAANLEFEDELEYVQLQGAHGVGLFRTESLLLGRDSFPSEDEQFEHYKNVAERVYPDMVIMRTFDIGGDKIAPESIEEANPFLGWRGIRISLDRPELFLDQLRAMLRASTRKNLAIMFPMVSSISEVRQAMEYVAKARADLRAKRIRFDDKIQVGVMIEVPAAAVIAEGIAAEADFLSIGTNDLIQYMLAVDRGNSFVSKVYEEFHPAVLKMIKSIIEAGHKHRKKVGMCGEMAGDPLATILLLGMGLDQFSVVPTFLPEVKKIIRTVEYTQARRAAKKALTFHTAEEVKAYLVGALRKMCPDVPLADANL